MSERYKFHNQSGLYFITPTVIRWVDVFTRDLYREILIESLNFCIENKGLNVHAWVFMTNHLHLVISTKELKMEHILRDFKKFTCNEITRTIMENNRESRSFMSSIFKYEGRHNPHNTYVQFWQNTNHPIELRDSKMIRQKINYIHQNPVRAGFVSEPEHWKHSSIHAYMGKPSLIKTEPLFDLMFDNS